MAACRKQFYIGFFHPSYLFGVQLSAYLVVRKASSPKNGGKEAPNYIALNCSISVRPDYFTPPFYSSVYSTWHLKIMPLSAYNIYKVSSICLKAHSSSL
jgi:hypothetical protein